MVQGPTHSIDASRLNREATAEAPDLETVETGLRDTLKGLCCKLLCAYAESRDDDGSRFQRDGRSWFRVVVKPKTIMNTLGPRSHQRARYRDGATAMSLVLVYNHLDSPGSRGRAPPDGR